MSKKLQKQEIGVDRFRLLVDAVQDCGIFMLDPSGIVLSWNSGAIRLTGYEASDVVGKHFSMFYPDAQQATGWSAEELRLAAEAGSYEGEGWRVRQDGGQFWAHVVITPIRDTTGQLTGYGNVTRDLTERRELTEALRRSEEPLRLLIEGVLDYAIYMVDPQGVIQSWNSGAQLITGYAAHEVIGKNYSIFFHSGDIASGVPATELKSALLRGRAKAEGWRVRKDGSTFWASIVMTPIIANGALLGYAKVTRDMTEQLRLRDLEHSATRMNEFLAMLAHELRNPLAPIRNAVSILQLEPAPSATVRTSRDMIDRQLTHMTRLVDDLLDAGRLTSGKIRIRPELVSFKQVLDSAVESMRPEMDVYSHVLTLDVPDQNICVKADKTRLTQVLQNLLGNATKFTPPGGAIKLTARVAHERLHVSVADNGVGIAPESLDTIFELFSQGDGIAASRQAGLGIGLSLARSLVEMHGGCIAVSSPGVGKGSVFTFELPGAFLSTGTPVDTDVESDAEKAPRILVVDDNRDAADSLAEILRLLGFSVRTAYDGSTALKLAGQGMPAVVFLDMGMPDIDGPTVLHSMRGLRGGENLFACAVSGLGPEDAKLGRTDFSQFDGRLQKPVELEDLRALLARAKNAGAVGVSKDATGALPEPSDL